jgi:hypothetical protein
VRPITDIPCECIACLWKGVTGQCDGADLDGNPCCPKCGAAVFIDYSPEELIPPDDPRDLNLGFANDGGGEHG